MDTYTLIRDAIVKKNSISGEYDGHYREMSPHVIGTNRKGRRQALFYQYAGTSKSGLGPIGSPENWRCIPVDLLSNVKIVEGVWHTALDHTQRQTCVAVIEAEVSY